MDFQKIKEAMDRINENTRLIAEAQHENMVLRERILRSLIDSGDMDFLQINTSRLNRAISHA